ncbi:MAG: transporter ATP-binding protein [Solirubrobacterales bacterium]|nr:transporter ATP-binding protein [Solirubrobacterales bacterium]
MHMFVRRRRRLVGLIAVCGAASLAGLPMTPASASDGEFSVKTLHFTTVIGPGDDTTCDIVGDLYKPASATKANPAPAILTTNGFGGSKNDQSKMARYYASQGYVVLSYSGLGFGGSGCKITLDDRDYDGKAGSQLVTFLGGGAAAVDGTRIDYVKRDAKGSDGQAHDFDPRIGMVGGSYGGQIQFAVAGIDPRVDTIIPFITWNDLSYSLMPNNAGLTRGVSSDTPGVTKVLWGVLFSTLGIVDGVTALQTDPSRILPCPNFDDRVCGALVQAGVTGAPSDAQIAFLRHASVVSFMDRIRIPTMLVQGQGDTLFNLRESVATYHSLKEQGTPVKLVWQFGGHSGPAAKGEADLTKPDETFEGRAVKDWFDHYLKGVPKAPSLDFTFFRDWVPYTGDATPAYGRAPDYPVVSKPRELYLSGTAGLVSEPGSVKDGTAGFLTTAAGAPTSYTEASAIDQKSPVSDVPGTTARFQTAPLTQDTDVVGVPSVDLRVSAPVQEVAGQFAAAAETALFFKLYDVAPDGTITLTHRVISPVRIANSTVPVHVDLPGTVHRFPKGHRLVLAVSGGDLAYRGNNIPGPVRIATSTARPGVLRLPVAEEGADYGKVVGAAVPPAKTCRSRRSFGVHIRSAIRSRVRSAVVTVGGRRVAVVRGANLRKAIPISLKGAGRKVVVVTLTMRLKSGKTVTDTRRYRPCATTVKARG